MKPSMIWRKKIATKEIFPDVGFAGALAGMGERLSEMKMKPHQNNAVIALPAKAHSAPLS